MWGGVLCEVVIINFNYLGIALTDKVQLDEILDLISGRYVFCPGIKPS